MLLFKLGASQFNKLVKGQTLTSMREDNRIRPEPFQLNPK